MRNALWVGGSIGRRGFPMLGNGKRGLSTYVKELFKNGEQGFFYDPNDLTTMFQDAAGTVPVTGSGQPVGLVLDKSKGLVLGSNLIPNGSFDADTNWSKSAGWTVSGGKANFDGLTAFSNIGSVTASSIKSKFLKVEFELSNVGASVTQARVLVSGALGATVPVTGNGKYSAIVIGGDVPSIGIQSQGASGAGFSFSLDNVSVKELSGNHAYQPTSAARPIFRQTPILGSELLPTYDFTSWGKLGVNTTTTANSVTVTDSVGGVTKGSLFQIGKTYKVSLTLNTSASNVLLINNTYGGAPLIANVTQGRVDTVFTATTSGLYIRTDIGTTTVTGMSIKEVLGYRTDQNYLEFDGVDDKLITSVSPAINNATVLTALVGSGTKVESGKYLTGNYEQTVSNAGVIILNRNLTRSERIAIDAGLTKITGATSLETLTFKAFDNNQEGFVYDPNDLSTMYQDTEGKTPVTSVGQPVGLILDKRKGSAVGINLHTTTTPMNTTSYPSIYTRTGLDITVSQEVSGYASVSLGMPTVVGKTYLLELIAPDVAGFWVLASDGASSDSANRRAAITNAPANKIKTKISFFFTASAAVTYIHLNRGMSTTSPATFKDVSVKEVLGNYAYQAASASRPILRKNAVTGANYLEFDGVDDHLILDPITLPIPFSHVMAVEDRRLSNTQALFSGTSSGYLMFAGESTLSVQQNAGNPAMYTVRGKKDVITHIANSAEVTLKSNLSAATSTDIVHKNPYAGVLRKYIGAFNDTQFSTAARIDYYGSAFIKDVIGNSLENNIRAHFNKRMGI